MFTRSLVPLLLLAPVAGCSLVPGSTYVQPHERVASRNVAYYDSKNPDKSTSYLLGVPKANPAWWVQNSDDPVPPADWRPNDDMATRERTWFLRNPFHNFTFYILGVADRPTRRFGLNAHSPWNDRGPINLAVTQAGPLLWLPMISYRGYFLEGYVGWRERGNLGATIRAAQSTGPANMPVPTHQPGPVPIQVNPSRIEATPIDTLPIGSPR